MNNKKFIITGRAALTALLVLTAVLASCDQSAIFFTISNEVEPKEPLIKGSPTKMVMFDSRAYVANISSLWFYSGSRWQKTSRPGKSVYDIAATDSALYAISGRTGPEELRKSVDGQNWTTIGILDIYRLQSIYGAGTALFVCLSDNDGNFTVYHDNGGTLDQSLTGLGREGMLRGAVELAGTYYLVTVDKGIYSATNPAGPFIQESGTTGRNLTGIIALADEVVAVGRDGAIIHGTTGDFTVTEHKNGRFSGALTVWPGQGAAELLLIGGTSYTSPAGYSEIALSGENLPPDYVLRNAGDFEGSTVDSREKYLGSLGIRTLNALFAVPYGDGTLFASTQKDGLWSYRNEWNAEE